MLSRRLDDFVDGEAEVRIELLGRGRGAEAVDADDVAVEADVRDRGALETALRTGTTLPVDAGFTNKR